LSGQPSANLCSDREGILDQLERGTTDNWEPILRPLLDHLASGEQPSDHDWRGWRISRVGGGWCNLLYRVSNAARVGCDLAIKFTMRDGRDRAGHEYGALHALREAGLNLAPRALLLDRDAYDQPVVVQTWLPGESSEALPANDDQWRALLEHLVQVHRVAPQRVSTYLERQALDATTAAQACERVCWQVERLPPEAQPASLRALLRRLEAEDWPTWPETPLGLCRCDNNVRNYIRRPGAWASVDWEYAGWGDPAFDVAQWATHASLTEAPLARWTWALEAYPRRVAELGTRDPALARDSTLSLRIWAYYRIMAAWWAARMARYLYEIPAGLDPRLAPWPEDWEENCKQKYAHYVALAERLYDT
jgi:aminoglycoside phosphotransferase (APT) family kinase protein